MAIRIVLSTRQRQSGGCCHDCGRHHDLAVLSVRLVLIVGLVGASRHSVPLPFGAGFFSQIPYYQEVAELFCSR